MSVNYVDILGEFYPGVEFVCHMDPTTYTNIIWLGGDPMPSAADLHAADLAKYKAAHIEHLAATCEAEIVNGFQSDALGTPHWYDSEREDQINLIGSAAAGDAMIYAVRDAQGGTKSYVMHTNAQLQQVLQDGRDIKLANLQQFNTLRGQVEAAPDYAAVDAIIWS